MRRLARLARLVGCSVAALAGAAVLAAPPALAAGASDPVGSPHPLGALLPTARLAPQVAPAVAGFAAARTASVLPASANLRPWAVAPGNQGSVNSCVSWTISYSMLGWYSRFTGRAGQPFAPMYSYAQLHIGADGGSHPVDTLRLAMTQGNDTKAHYPQGDFNWQTTPTLAERASAARFKIKGYTTLFSGANQAGITTVLRQALATNHPVAINLAVRQGFEYLGASANATDDDITTPVVGYHEVLAVGYDATGITIENSWGTGWAGDGFGRISWRVVQRDVWEAQTIEGFAPVPTPPVVSTPTVSSRAQTLGAAGTRAYTLTWKGATGTSGAITKYEAWFQTDGGALVSVRLASVRATSLTLAARVGHHYRIAVRATAGSTVGALRYSAIFAG